MVNYQLYHSNVFLGGQMKYDLIVETHKTDLVVSDFHITPISRAVPYNKNANDDLLNYTHSENISSFYKNTSGSFYSIPEEPADTSLWPEISVSRGIENINPDNTYGMGCNRAVYKVYNKQFEFFCPIWLEHISPEEQLDFQFEIRLSKNGRVVGTKNLILDINNDKPDYHNRFVRYLNEYLTYINIMGDGDDKLLYIGQRNCLAHGINIVNGKLKECKVNILNNMLYREKPLMEDDYIIISSLQNNRLIAKQLFNFNICFNIEDILSGPLCDMVIGKDIYVDVKVGIRGNNNRVLDARDFYSDYTNILCKSLNIPGVSADINDSKLDIEITNNNVSHNALTYLYDTRYIHHVLKNKITQPIIHWSLVGNNDYIFNTYPGFMGVYEDDNSIKHYVPYKYNGAPDLVQKEYKQSLNNNGWCNVLQISPACNMSVLINNLDIVVNQYGSAIEVTGEYSWMNNIKYFIKDYNNRFKTYKFLQLFDDRKDINNDIYTREHKKIKIGDKTLIIYKIEKYDIIYIVLHSNDMNLLTYKSVINIINEHYIELYNLINPIIGNPVYPLYMKHYNTLDVTRADSPSSRSKEIDYIKNSNQGQGVERYIGSIRPMFVDNGNYLYYKPLINNYNQSVFYKYKDSNYLPKYPSIGFYPYKSIELDYNTNPGNYNTLTEYKWYRVNKLINIVPEIKTTLSSVISSGEYVSIKDLIKIFLSDYYNINNNDTINYIYNLYKTESSYEYDKIDLENNLHSYKYNIKLTLK